jgi:KDO2-lipid IV(A) lauroyltransferase
MINELHSRGKGVILLSGHFGNWELLAYSAGLFSGLPALIIVKPQKNKVADDLLNSYRMQRGNSVISMYNAAFTIFKQLKKGGVVALLADQSATKDKDIYIDFFGIPAATYESPAELALKLDVPIVMGFAVRQSDGTYSVDLQEIKHDDLEHNKEGIEELTRRHVSALENAIRANPNHWAWQHRKWKHTDQFMERMNELS